MTLENSKEKKVISSVFEWLYKQSSESKESRFATCFVVSIDEKTQNPTVEMDFTFRTNMSCDLVLNVMSSAFVAVFDAELWRFLKDKVNKINVWTKEARIKAAKEFAEKTRKETLEAFSQLPVIDMIMEKIEK